MAEGLNGLLQACPFPTGEVECTADGNDRVLTYKTGSSSCIETSKALNSIVKEYTGPADGREEDIGCFAGSYFNDNSQCLALLVPRGL